jgi:CrcB protein
VNSPKLFVNLRGRLDLIAKMMLVMLGGSFGALSRYAIALITAKYIDSRFPWGTLLANLIGCFLIGIAFGLAERTSLLGPSTRLFFMTGYLGALTTFSTYALETFNSLGSGSSPIAIANFLVNNFGGILFVFAGIFLIQFILMEK